MTVSLVAFSDATISSLGGMYEALFSFDSVRTHEAAVADPAGPVPVVSRDGPGVLSGSRASP